MRRRRTGRKWCWKLNEDSVYRRMEINPVKYRAENWLLELKKYGGSLEVSLRSVSLGEDIKRRNRHRHGSIQLFEEFSYKRKQEMGVVESMGGDGGGDGVITIHNKQNIYMEALYFIYRI